MTQRNSNIALKIGALIPGFNGYLDRSERRNNEKIFREVNSNILERSEQTIITYQKSLIGNDISLLKEWEQVRKNLNTLISKFRHAAYGESSFFSSRQIKEDELSEVLRFDEEIVDRIQLIFKATENEMDQVFTRISILNNINQIDEILHNRMNFIRYFK
jgi:hypothetical protein